MVMELQKTISVDAFEDLMAQPEYAGRRMELIDGTLVEMSKTSLGHGQIVMRLGRIIGNYVEEHDLGYLTGADAGFILERNPDGKDTMRGLDIAFIAKDRASSRLPFALGQTSPDLAIEVMSPSNSVWDMRLKVRQLLKAGVKLVWIVHPDFQEVEAYTSDSSTTYAGDDILSGGMSCPASIFASAKFFPLEDR